MRIGLLSLIWKIYVGIIFTITAIIMYPFLTLFTSIPKLHETAFKTFVFWSWFFRILTCYHVKRTGLENLPKAPYVIAPNHASYLDIFVMHSTLPRDKFLFLGKAEILSYPLIRRYFKGFNIPVYRKNRMKAAKSYIKSKQKVKEGWSIVIFPEGGIPDEGKPKMMDFKPGAFRLAKEMNIPIVPITFLNNHKLFSDPMDWFGPCRPGISKVIIHPPVTVDQIKTMTSNEISDFCFKVINQPLLDHYPEIRD